MPRDANVWNSLSRAWEHWLANNIYLPRPAAAANALKIYIAISHANVLERLRHAPPATAEDYRSCRLSYERVAQLTGVARGDIHQALEVLEASQSVRIERHVGRSGNQYELLGDLTPPFGRLPTGYLFEKNKHLRDIPSDADGLRALALYFLLHLYRDRQTDCAALSFAKMGEKNPWAFRDPATIRRALTMLATVDFIAVEAVERTENPGSFQTRSYRLLGGRWKPPALQMHPDKNNPEAPRLVAPKTMFINK